MLLVPGTSEARATVTIAPSPALCGRSPLIHTTGRLLVVIWVSTYRLKKEPAPRAPRRRPMHTMHRERHVPGATLAPSHTRTWGDHCSPNPASAIGNGVRVCPARTAGHPTQGGLRRPLVPLHQRRARLRPSGISPPAGLPVRPPPLGTCLTGPMCAQCGLQRVVQ